MAAGRVQMHMGWTVAAAAGFAAALLAARAISTPSGAGFSTVAVCGIPILFAAAVYLLSHALRIVRLAVLLNGRFDGFRRLAVAHLAGSMVSGLTPYRCGEVFRIVAIARVGADFGHSFKAVAVERGLDAAGLAAVCGLLSWLEPGWSQVLTPVAGAIGMLIVLFAALLRGAPENARLALCYVIRTYTSARALRFAAALATAEEFLRDTPRMLFGRVGATASLTAVIWALDILSAGVVARSAEGTWLLGAFGTISALLRMPGGGMAAMSESLPVAAMAAIGAWNSCGTAIILGVAAAVVACLGGADKKKERRP